MHGARCYADDMPFRTPSRGVWCLVCTRPCPSGEEFCDQHCKRMFPEDMVIREPLAELYRSLDRVDALMTARRRAWMRAQLSPPRLALLLAFAMCYIRMLVCAWGIV